MYESFDIIHKRTNKNPLDVFKQAVENARPLLETKSRRIGGATYQVPMEVAEKRKQALAIRWIINFSRNRSGKSMTDKLAAELMDAYNKEGGAIKKREDTHRMAEANKAFAHFRW